MKDPNKINLIESHISNTFYYIKSRRFFFQINQAILQSTKLKISRRIFFVEANNTCDILMFKKSVVKYDISEYFKQPKLVIKFETNMSK